MWSMNKVIPTPKKVRPIQMGEFLQEYVFRRLLALNEGEIAALTLAIRQLGVGSQGGAEALAILFFPTSSCTMCGRLAQLNIPRARIQVDERNCFVMIEWRAVREASRRFLPKHAAPAGWEHRALTYVEQEGVPPMPKDRSAEQGFVDGLLECSLTLGMVAAETRSNPTAQQAAGLLP